MFQDNPLLAQLKQQMKATLPTKEGTIKATERGFGFLETDKQESFFIPPNYMRKVIHGDRIKAILRTENDKEIAEPDELLATATKRFVGRVKRFKGRLSVVPESPLIKTSIKAKAVNGISNKDLEEGDWVVAELTQHALKDDGFLALIKEQVAKADDSYASRWVTLARLELAKTAPDFQQDWLLLNENEPRKDLTDSDFFTIDNASTLDMDDALLVKQTGKGWTLTVAVADPTAYIAPDSDVDAEAAKRAFTVYLPGYNVPILPRELSDELCSLKQDEKRAALCCEMQIDSSGSIEADPVFYLAWINSKHKLAYDNVSDWLEPQSESDWTPEADLAQQLTQLQALTQARLSWRSENAIVFKDRPDYVFKLDEQGALADIKVEPRRIANRMVEEAMVAANICGATLLKSKLNKGLFNVQTGIPEDRLQAAVKLLIEHHIETDKESLASLTGFCHTKRQLGELPSCYLDYRLRRLQAYAEFSAEPAPHYAMGLEVYATWTSPIRKYSDMINHRLIKSVLLDDYPATDISPQQVQLQSDCRRLHRMAENNVANWLYAGYLKPFAGKDRVFDAELTDVVRGGIKVKLLEVGAFIFIPASFICKDKKRLVCRWETGHVLLDGQVLFEQGQTLSVNIAEVNLETKNLIGKTAQVLPAKPAQAE